MAQVNQQKLGIQTLTFSKTEVREGGQIEDEKEYFIKLLMNGEPSAESKPSVGFKYEEDEGDLEKESFSIDIYDMAHSIKILLYEKDGEDMIGEAKKYCHAICNNSSQVEEFEIDDVVTISMVVEYKDLTKQS